MKDFFQIFFQNKKDFSINVGKQRVKNDNDRHLFKS